MSSWRFLRLLTLVFAVTLFDRGLTLFQEGASLLIFSRFGLAYVRLIPLLSLCLYLYLIDSAMLLGLSDNHAWLAGFYLSLYIVFSFKSKQR